MDQGALDFSYEKAMLEDGTTGWRVCVDEGSGPCLAATGATLADALERAYASYGIRVLDKTGFPPGKISRFPKDANLVRNVAVLRTGLYSLYCEVKDLEWKLPRRAHSAQEFDVNGIYAQLAVKFDWFSVSMLNLMEGVSLLNTLATIGDYHKLASTPRGMKVIQRQAREYTKSIPEAKPLRLWRNKVAAHRSGIAPPPKRGSGDSMTTKLISLAGIQVGAKNGRYVAPGMIPSESGQAVDTLGVVEWSLTETWENLARARYQWLDDGSFFDEVSSWNIGPGRQLHGMDLRSLDLTEQQMKELREGLDARRPPSALFEEPKQ